MKLTLENEIHLTENEWCSQCEETMFVTEGTVSLITRDHSPRFHSRLLMHNECARKYMRKFVGNDKEWK